ncbi:hypothetical protein BGW38_007664 [Lunasporangiospora selenospora]|uniref:Uncharacterized protein n=1 Tax=Lunasporangiospora selenospora TaxID=979761 RepID=A0A9P6FL38_9FUNG|nr:hypothetical protein BGW38_007664 [Lunasporangiospora selenospora]
MDGPSSPIFEYTPHPEDHDPTSEYYVDNEETRYSMDRQRSAQASSSAGPSGSRVPPLPTTSTATTSRRGGSSNQRTSSDSDITHSDSESDQDIDPLGDDYERVLEQETFVLQITIQDLVSYLVSSQDVISLPRLAESGSALASVTSRTAAEANSRVQNLPV